MYYFLRFLNKQIEKKNASFLHFEEFNIFERRSKQGTLIEGEGSVQ